MTSNEHLILGMVAIFSILTLFLGSIGLRYRGVLQDKKRIQSLMEE